MKILTNKVLLKQVSVPISLKDGLRLGRTLLSSLLTHNKHARGNTKQGVGLSAPQIGIFNRVFVTLINQRQRIFVNPVILERSDQQTLSKEGCLSLPKVELTVLRYLWIKLAADNYREPLIFGLHLQNQLQTNSFLEGTVIQHELDHLNGILITDRAKEHSTLLVDNPADCGL